MTAKGNIKLLLLLGIFVTLCGLFVLRYIQTDESENQIKSFISSIFGPYKARIISPVPVVIDSHNPVFTIYSSHKADILTSYECPVDVTSVQSGNTKIKYLDLDHGTYHCQIRLTSDKGLINIDVPVFTVSATPPKSTPVTKKVLLLIYNPKIETADNIRLVNYKKWPSPEVLTRTFISDLREISGGYLNYVIAEKVILDEYPIKDDGFVYTDKDYLDCVSSGGTLCHTPDLADYGKIISKVSACEKRNKGAIDELWVWGGPWFGYFESNLTGPNAYWLNSYPTTDTTCTKLLPIMGFNYERGVTEMLEDYGHRMESEMKRVFGGWEPDTKNAWNKFTVLDWQLTSQGGCGNVHNAVNASAFSDYDRANARTVVSSCDDFLNYPNFTENTTQINCVAWGCTTYDYLKWWFKHIPRFEGTVEGIKNNWWDYVVNF